MNEQQEKFKQTDIGLIPSDWEVKKLSDVCDLTSSKRIFESDYVKIGIPFYRGKEISLLNENKKLEEEYFISEEKYEAIKRVFGSPTKDDILITAVGTLGNVYLVPNDDKFYFKDGNLIWLRNIKDVLPSYLSIQLNWLRNEITNSAIGSSQKALTIIVLRNQYFPLPPTKTEQTAIATALGDADTYISSLEKLIAKKQAIKQGAMQKLLSPKEGWVVKKFNEIFYKTPSKNYQINSSEYQDNGKFPIIDQGKTKVVGYSDRTDKVYKCPNKGIIIFGDHTRILKYVREDFIVGADGTQLISTIGNHSNLFFYYLLSTKEIPNTGYNRHYKFLLEMEFFFPSPEEQTHIATILSDMDADIAATEKQLAKARSMKQGMMQQLLTGRIRLV